MPVEITIPSPGESVTEVTLGPWAKSDGAWVEKDELLVEIESDKVTLEVPAPDSGMLSISANEGDEKSVGDVIGSIDPSAKKPDVSGGVESQDDAKKEVASKSGDSRSQQENESAARNEVATATSAAASDSGSAGVRATSLAKKVAADKGVDLKRVEGSGPSGRIRRSDVLAAGTAPAPSQANGGGHITVAGERGIRREKMSRLRQRIAQRLVEAQHNAAMLTTFNEVDMTEVMRVRKQHKDSFSVRFGVNLGFMSFFVKASTSALMEYPRVNAYITSDEIEYHDYCDVSIAVGTDKGLVVPVLRNAEQMTFADVEATIKDFAVRAREGKLSIDEMTGGTFTISNGGVYGSLNSTPILNPPQSGILGMHRIQNRPIEDPNNPGSIVLRPMMYLAMSYDHRIVDGAEAVSFLVHVKNALEHPERMLLGM